jgi:predicted homoserine dehydrogenase-like protein
MRVIGSGEMGRVKHENTSSMSDVFVIGVATETVDSAGRITVAYVDVAAQPGSLINPTGKFRDDIDKIVQDFDAVLRTDNISIIANDRITFVNKNGAPVDPDVFYAMTDVIQYRHMILYPLRRTEV